MEPVEKPKRILSEDALAKLAVARVKAIEARKHNCAVRREAKAASKAVPETVPDVVVPSAPSVPDVVAPSAPSAPDFVSLSGLEDAPLTKKHSAPARRRQKIVLYSDSDSDDEAVYIKTKRRKRSPKDNRSPKRHRPHTTAARTPEPPVEPAPVPAAPVPVSKVVVPRWLSF
tara:strand:- start:48 stop:563 length:516 start_codon:yes stop_codon:yes gene_type:complete